MYTTVLGHMTRKSKVAPHFDHSNKCNGTTDDADGIT